MTAVVVPGPSVTGNVSSCEILNQLVKTDLAHWYSFVQVDHYQSFNTCTGKDIAEYSIPSVTELWGAPLLVVSILFASALLIFAMSFPTKRY